MWDGTRHSAPQARLARVARHRLERRLDLVLAAPRRAREAPAGVGSGDGEAALDAFGGYGGKLDGQGCGKVVAVPRHLLALHDRERLPGGGVVGLGDAGDARLRAARLPVALTAAVGGGRGAGDGERGGGGCGGDAAFHRADVGAPV